eukprot:1144507-Pelagomonas_calceolata.AAC.3
MGDTLPDKFKPLSEYEGSLVWSKGLVWHAGNTGVWLRWSSMHQNQYFSHLDTPTPVSRPLELVGFGPTEGRTKAGRSSQAPTGHLRAR